MMKTKSFINNSKEQVSEHERREFVSSSNTEQNSLNEDNNNNDNERTTNAVLVNNNHDNNNNNNDDDISSLGSNNVNGVSLEDKSRKLCRRRQRPRWLSLFLWNRNNHEDKDNESFISGGDIKTIVGGGDIKKEQETTTTKHNWLFKNKTKKSNNKNKQVLSMAQRELNKLKYQEQYNEKLLCMSKKKKKNKSSKTNNNDDIYYNMCDRKGMEIIIPSSKKRG